MQGIQPKNNNNGKAQMFVILLASMCITEKLLRVGGLDLAGVAMHILIFSAAWTTETGSL